MTETFFQENQPPAWAVKLARARLLAEGEPEPEEWPLRRLAWEITQEFERDIARCLP